MSSVEWNGTLIEGVEAIPWIGFNRRQMLQDRIVRRRHGLAPIGRQPPLTDEAAARRSVLRADSDWVSFEATVSTSADQIAVAPGYLVREWTQNGRRSFHYKMDAPMQNHFCIVSARYAVAEAQQDGVRLQVFYI